MRASLSCCVLPRFDAHGQVRALQRSLVLCTCACHASFACIGWLPGIWHCCQEALSDCSLAGAAPLRLAARLQTRRSGARGPSASPSCAMPAAPASCAPALWGRPWCALLACSLRWTPALARTQQQRMPWCPKLHSTQRWPWQVASPVSPNDWLRLDAGQAGQAVEIRQLGGCAARTG